MEAEHRAGQAAGPGPGHERGAGDWQHYQSPRDILAAVARQNQGQQPPGPPGQASAPPRSADDELHEPVIAGARHREA